MDKNKRNQKGIKRGRNWHFRCTRNP